MLRKVLKYVFLSGTALVLLGGPVLAYNDISMFTYTKLSNNTAPSSATFIAYYNGSDSIIQTEDSWNDTNNNEGYAATASVGLCMANSNQVTGLTSASKYEIWVSSGSEGGYASGTVGNSGSTFTSKGSYSDPLILSSGNLATPSNFTAAGQAGSVALSWQKVTGASGYTIYKRPAAGYSDTTILYEKIKYTTATSWADTYVTAGKTYYYIIVASATGKRSGHSDEVSATASAGAPVTLSSISVSPTSVNLSANGQQAYTVTATYSNNTTKPVSGTTWSYTKGTMVGDTYTAPSTISADETLTLTASYTEGATKTTASTTVNLKAAAVLQSISVSPTSVNLNANGQQTFTVTATYSDYSTSPVSATWSGYTKGTMVGDTYTAPSSISADETLTLTATYTEGTTSASDNVTVNLKSATLQSISLSPSSATLKAGSSQKFSVTAYYSDGSSSEVTGSLVTWAVTGGIGTVDAQGNFTGSTAGTGSLTATYQTESISASISVSAGALAAITVGSAADQVKVGETLAFTASGKDASGNAVSVTPTWSSSAGSITSAGVLTAPQKTGTATVSATVGSVSGKKTVSVIPGDLYSITVSPSQATLEVGETQQFTAKGYDKYGNEIPNLSFSYSSTLGNTSAQTATTPGDYTLTVSSGSVSKTASIRVFPEVSEIKFAASSYVVGASGASISAQAYDKDGKAVSVTGIAYDVTGKEDGNAIDQNGNLTPGTKEGSYTVTAQLTIKDKTYSASVKVEVSLYGPKITVSIGGETLTGDKIISSKPKMDIKLEDGNGVQNVIILVDGKEVPSASITKASAAGAKTFTASFTPSDKLSEGVHSIYIESADTLGNSSVLEISGLRVYAELRVEGLVLNYPNPFKPSTQSTIINYKLTGDADVRMYIYDIGGRVVYSASFDAGFNGGRAYPENDVTWDGRDMTGAVVANGVYVCVISSGGKVLGKGEISVYE